jgi:predicted esterase
MLATDVALHYPEMLGGLIIWSGALICESNWKSTAEKQQKLAIVQTHGRQDMILSHAGALDLKSMLQTAGHQVLFLDFDGPHTIPTEGLEMAAELIADCIKQTQTV